MVSSDEWFFTAGTGLPGWGLYGGGGGRRRCRKTEEGLYADIQMHR